MNCKAARHFKSLVVCWPPLHGHALRRSLKRKAAPILKVFQMFGPARSPADRETGTRLKGKAAAPNLNSLRIMRPALRRNSTSDHFQMEDDSPCTSFQLVRAPGAGQNNKRPLATTRVTFFPNLVVFATPPRGNVGAQAHSTRHRLCRSCGGQLASSAGPRRPALVARLESRFPTISC